MVLKKGGTKIEMSVLRKRLFEKGMDMRKAVSVAEVPLVRGGSSNVACVVK